MTLDEHLAEAIPKAARNRHRRFPHVPYEDFEQELVLRVLAKQAKFALWHEEGKIGTIWLELLNAGTALGYQDDRNRRAAKAAAAGYSPDDEEFYSTGMLRHLLPVLIEAEFDPANAVERATQGTDAAGVRIHGSSPENAAETYMVVLIDVVTAFRKLSPYQRNLLMSYYALDQSDTESGRWERESKASSMGMTFKAYQRKVDRAVDELADKLGGKNPWIRSGRRDQAGKAA